MYIDLEFTKGAISIIFENFFWKYNFKWISLLKKPDWDALSDSVKIKKKEIGFSSLGHRDKCSDWMMRWTQGVQQSTLGPDLHERAFQRLGHC